MSSNHQYRLVTGHTAQRRSVMLLSSIAGERLLDTNHNEKISRNGTDVWFTLHNESRPYRVEVKGERKTGNQVVFINSYISARKDVIKSISNTSIDKITTMILNSKSIVSSDTTFADFLIECNKTDPKYGFPGSSSVKSGSLPPDILSSTEPSVLTEIDHLLHQHFASKKDDYLIIYNHADHTSQLYHTGISKRNPLNAPTIPPVAHVQIATYGGARKQAMRVAVRVRF